MATKSMVIMRNKLHPNIPIEGHLATVGMGTATNKKEKDEQLPLIKFELCNGIEIDVIMTHEVFLLLKQSIETLNDMINGVIPVPKNIQIINVEQPLNPTVQ